MENLIGKDLGRYHVIEPLGQGGMASVFKAYDTNLERFVAIKIIRSDIAGGVDSEFLKRFQREAKSLAQLDHPYILKVLDYGEEGGVPYLVMPYLQGGTLKEKMGQPMPSEEAAALLAPIARALEYAHQQNIIHRDVKPANILISKSGAPILSDFGIAKILVQSGSTQLTAAGVGIGTPDYMAPEQWTGSADPRTDIYSLGVVFYQMVTGRLPFSADTPAAVLIKHLRDPLPRPKTFVPGLPDVVEQVLFKALAKEPESRFQTMGEFATTLEKLERSDHTVIGSSAVEFETVRGLDATAIASGEAGMAQRPVTPTPAPRKMEGWKIGLIVFGIIAVVGILCIVLGGGTYFASRMMSPSQNKATAPVTGVEIPGTQPSREPGLGVGTPGQEQTQPTLPLPINPAATTAAGNPSFTTIEGFPDDVPLLTDNNGDLSKTTSQGMNIYSYTTNMPYDQVVEFFKSGMEKNGWTVMSETTQGGQASSTYTKGQDQNRMVMINLANDGETTQVTEMLISQ
jgi:tRNA A-37 threonylcarbamoyl transferase component Bud32